MSPLLIELIPQLVQLAMRIGSSVIDMLSEMTPEERQAWLDKTYDEIAVKKRLQKNSETGKWEWISEHSPE